MSAAIKEEFKPTAGVHIGLEQIPYRRAEGVSSSTLKDMKRSPAYARMREKGSSDSTAAKDWGSAIHCAILEPQHLAERYPVDPESPKGGYPAGWRNTKAYKEMKADLLAPPEVEGLLTLDQSDDLYWIQERVKQNEIAKALYEVPGVKEASVFAWDEEFELWRKCRPDWLAETINMIVDVKSTRNHTKDKFARDCFTFGYHISAAYYMDTCAMVDIPIDHHPFLAVANEKPFEPAPYTLDEDSIELGRQEYRKLLAQYRDCRELGKWPAGSNEIEEIRLPAYAFYQD